MEIWMVSQYLRFVSLNRFASFGEMASQGLSSIFEHTRDVKVKNTVQSYSRTLLVETCLRCYTLFIISNFHFI
jgi:hypothetical protein